MNPVMSELLLLLSLLLILKHNYAYKKLNYRRYSTRCVHLRTTY